MSTSRKAAYCVLAIAAFALAINAPGLMEGRKQRRAVESTFKAYSSALVQGDYQEAFHLCDDEFQTSVPFGLFVAQQNKLNSILGRLRAIENAGTFVHGRGSPMRWVAVINAHQVYERGQIDFVCEFHLENTVWKLLGCKQV
jgi:hypothetical protein